MHVTADSAAKERLLDRLNEPRTIEALEHILDRLELVAFGLDAADGFLRRGETVVDAVGDGLRELRKAAESAPGVAASIGRLPKVVEAGGKLAEIVEQPGVQNLLASGLLEKLGQPRTIQALAALLDRAEMISFLVTALEQFLARGESFTDAMADGLTDLRKIAASVDTTRAAGLYDGLPKVVDAGLGLIDSGMLDRDVVHVLGQFGRIGATAYEEWENDPAANRPVGPWGMIKALRDPDVQRATGVLLHVAKKFGQSLNAAVNDHGSAST